MPNGDDRDINEERLQQPRRDAATVVHALDTAVQLIDTLIAWMPEGNIISHDLGRAKNAFDRAFAAMQRPTPPTPTYHEKEKAEMAAMLNRLKDEERRLHGALKIAGFNIASLNDQRATLTNALHSAMALVDAAMSELANTKAQPNFQLISAHKSFTAAMDKLLGNSK